MCGEAGIAVLDCSIFEGISLAILEAMATGIPAVATAVDGTPEVVTPETGVLVEPRTVREYSAVYERAGGH